jgi:uroporphyrin-III C-methyltransferase/precorrin-2 dehydrogenase/sirohydrochlorin ferrochelatase/uroporphyrin-III C-methyltransferase
MKPRVYLTGAGPGDPELLTLKALRVIQAADVILYDNLVNETILQFAPAQALRIDVGKRCGKRSAAQFEINRLLVEHAGSGNVVVRLKGGDPMIFGRISEEVQALEAHSIPYEIIPGVTAASAAAASLGLSLTKRKIARSVHFLTGHGAEDGLPAHDWVALTRGGGTLVIYMGRETLAGLAAHFIEAGMAPSMPAIAVENASLPSERITRGTLVTLPRALRAVGGNGPTLIILGEALQNAFTLSATIKMAAAK